MKSKEQKEEFEVEEVKIHAIDKNQVEELASRIVKRVEGGETVDCSCYNHQQGLVKVIYTVLAGKVS